MVAQTPGLPADTDVAIKTKIDISATLKSFAFKMSGRVDQGLEAQNRRNAIKRRAKEEYPVAYIVYALSSFTYTMLGISMLTIFRDLPHSFRENCLINLDLYAVLLVIQGPVSFWADVLEDMIWMRKGLGQFCDSLLAPTLTVLAISGSLYWGELLSNEELYLARTLITGPIIFCVNRMVTGKFPEKFILHSLWHISMPVIGAMLLSTIISRRKLDEVVE
mmetsp:Transcript_15525/g.25273  ORF Transcript_15525/g.25273 Transcript_15525/m.25273 type:complete len:220 (+) Transcript_15525:57-716(+)